MSDLIPSEGKYPDTSHIFVESLQALTEGLTGIVASDKKDLLISLGQILQKVRGRRLLHLLNEEWNKYRKKGKIKDDYIQTEQHQECLQEMLDFLDRDVPDHLRFTVLKKIFLAAASEEKLKRDSVLPQQYMRIIRTLNSSEVLVLNANYQIAEAKVGDWESKEHSAKNWLTQTAEKSGLVYPELVETCENSLVNKHLLLNRKEGDPNVIHLGANYRLTQLGFGICEFVDEGES